LKRVSAAVFVAAKTEGTGADRKTVPRTPEEIEKLRKIVQSALGLQPNDPVRKDEITLEEMPFTDVFPVEVAQQIQKQQSHEIHLGGRATPATACWRWASCSSSCGCSRKASAETASMGSRPVPNGEGNGKGRGTRGLSPSKSSTG
jgi:hypothetical protein